MYIILFAVFIDLVGFGLIIPILPFITMALVGEGLTIEFLGASIFLSAATLGTGMMAVYSLAAFLFGPLWGRLSDRIGRKSALAITFLGSSAAYILLAHAETIWMVLLARTLSGAMAGNVGIVMAAMADLTDSSNRGRAMGLIGGAFGLGFAVGPGIGGLLSGVDDGGTGLYYPGIAAAAMSLLALVLTLWRVPETSATEDLDPQAKRPGVGTMVFASASQFFLMLMFLLTAMAQGISFSIFPFWASASLGWAAMAVGLMMMGIGVMVFISQSFLAGILFRTIGELRSITLGCAIQIVGCFFVLTMPPSLPLALFAFPLVLIGLTISFPALSSLLSQRTHKSIQGTVLGFSSGISALGRVAGPLYAGYLFLPESPATPFVAVTVIGVFIVAWTFLDPFLTRPQSMEQASK